MRQALETGQAEKAQKLAIAAGIATDKHLLLSGRPTAIVAGIQEHRHEIGPLMARLARLAEQLHPAKVTEPARPALTAGERARED